MAVLILVCQRIRSLLPTFLLLLIVADILYLFTGYSVVNDAGRRVEMPPLRPHELVNEEKSSVDFRDSNTNTGLVASSPEARLMENQEVYKTPAGYPESCYKFDARFPVLRREARRKDGLEKRKCTKRLPRAFVIGVKKGGSQTLTWFLDLHPAIARSTSSLKWFRGIDVDPAAVKRQVVRNMPLTSPGQVTLFDHPGFLVNTRELFRKIPSSLGIENVKILVILRSPVKRAISDYAHLLHGLTKVGVNVHDDSLTKERRGDDIRASFADTVIDKENGRVNATTNIIGRGRYITYLTELYQAFDHNQILIVDGVRFAEDPAGVLQSVETFMEVPPFFTDSSFEFQEDKGFYCANVSFRPDLKCMPTEKGRVHPMVEQDTIDKVTEYYRPYNKKLASFLRTKGYEPFPWLYE